MKQNEILAIVLVGIFVAVAGWFVTTSFISNPEERIEEVEMVRTFTPEFDSQAIFYLKDDSTKVYTVDIDVKDSVGSGNEEPFSGQ